MDPSHVWPLFALELRTPRLVLRPVRDDDLPELVEAARAGLFGEGADAFEFAWQQGTADEVRRNVVRHQWELRAAMRPEAWTLQLAVLLDGRAVGVQDLGAKDLAVARQVGTASWLTRSAQGQGIGTEMRQAVLLLAFDHLDAEVAISGYIEGNEASAAVSRRLGYRDAGSVRVALGDRKAEERRLRLDRDDLVRPDWRLEVVGLEAARADLLGD